MTLSSPQAVVPKNILGIFFRGQFFEVKNDYKLSIISKDPSPCLVIEGDESISTPMYLPDVIFITEENALQYAEFLI